MVRNSYARSTHLAKTAGVQHGVFTAAQFLEAGFTRDQLRYRVRTGEIVAIDAGVYRQVGTPPSWRQRIMAACLAGPAVASHRSAGLLWSLPGMSEDLVEVTALRHRRRRPPDVVWHESYRLDERDVTEIEGIPVTRPVRTFVDLGVVLSLDELEAVLNEGVRRHLLSVAAIWRRLEAFGLRRPGSRVVQAVLSRHVPNRRAPESVLETRFLQLVRSACLPAPVPQYEVTLPGGSVVRLDFAYPRPMVGIELDGAVYHSGERAERRDRRRDTRLGAIGWRILRFGWDEVTRTPDYVVSTVDASLMRT
jgi:very-short-patch-repair endonuclease